MCLKPGATDVADVARHLLDELTARGVAFVLDPQAAAILGGEGVERGALAEKADMLIVIGGDGTLLAVAREAGARPIPILGVNQGTLGFLAEVAPEELDAVLDQVLAGSLDVVLRTRLRVRAMRGDEELMQVLALNDAVINRSDLSRMIDVETWTNGEPVTVYRGDGLIVATPTGSTAYTLSAGGPILMPGSRALVLTPICPHGLSQRPVVVPDTSRIEMHVFPREGTAQLTLDGQVAMTLESGDRVLVEASEHPAHFVVSPFRSRFDVLRSKLGWGRA
ncbi:MAG: NAD(+)/NADH kinase [bacterium]|nr:NAD(+)/NADH kinase [bacterium]MCP5069558.1 NAD(+)/NADH kinase [bacterium]